MFKLSRLLIVYAVAVPLALLLGYLVVEPSQFTFVFIGGVLFILAFPLLLKWHHVLLIVFWNSIFFFGFLPGAPDFWLFFAIIGFVIAFLTHVVFQKPFLRAPELTRPLLFLAVVIIVTAEIRGGIGIRALGGGSYGGKYYLYELGAIAGYFAFASQAVPARNSKTLGELFFFSGTSAVLSNIIFLFGSAFYFLYYIVPPGGAISQAMGEAGLIQIERIGGLATACISALCFLLARYGVRGIFDMGRPWRLFWLCLTFGAAFFGGFRSIMVILFLIFAFQFYFEGLLRTHYFPIVVGLAICGLAPILFFAHSMPPAVQRAISFLPVNVDSEILQDAKGSAEWRFQMWGVVSREIPKYLLVGKGYSIDPGALFGAVESARLGIQTSDYEASMLSGDYHSGPLSVIIPFGLFGSIAFVWVLYGGYRVVSSNRRFGDPRLRRLNTVLLSAYLTYCLSFFFIFGSLNTELAVFLGFCGMSVSLNGGVKRRTAPKPAPRPIPQTTLAVEAG